MVHKYSDKATSSKQKKKKKKGDTDSFQVTAIAYGGTRISKNDRTKSRGFIAIMKTKTEQNKNKRDAREI